MHHVRVGLDRHQLLDLDAPVLADGAEVVARRGRPASRARRAPSRPRAARCARSQVLLGRRRPRARAGDRPALDAAAAHLHQRLRRRAGDREVVELEEVHVGRRVDVAQPAVDRERLDRAGPGPALGGHDLKGVALRGCSRFARSTGRSNCSRVMLDAKCRGRSASARGTPRPVGARHRLGEQRARALDQLRRALVGRARRRRRRSTNALTMIVTWWRRWSNTISASETISAMSGVPTSSGFGSGRRSTVRTRSYPNMPTAPPANGGRSSSGATR